MKNAFIESSMKKIDPLNHYKGNSSVIEYDDLPECESNIKNIGWTLGNDCPYRCKHCYSMSARIKGKNFNTSIVDRIISQLSKNKVETVNLGGNEPLFTNGTNPKKSLLPYIIERLSESGMKVGLTTSGISLIYLEKYHRKTFDLLNDVDISLDSPIEEEHNFNRGANLFKLAIKSLEICKSTNKDHSIILCAMNWNFTKDRIEKLIDIALKYNSNIRINPIKPVEPSHSKAALSALQYFEGFLQLSKSCQPIDLGEPPIAALSHYSNAKGCPCGRTSFRIHSITPDGKIPVSPCVYLHDYKVGNLIEDELFDIIRTPQFRIFRMRNKNPHLIKGCEGCNLLESCKGGCAARSYLHNLYSNFTKSLFIKDPFCPKEFIDIVQFPEVHKLDKKTRLVHMDYLCTWIGRPINKDTF